MNRKTKEMIDELGYNLKSLQKLRKSELIDVVNVLADVVAELEQELKGTAPKSEVNRMKVELDGARKEMDFWRKKHEQLVAKTSGKVGFGIRNPRAQ